MPTTTRLIGLCFVFVAFLALASDALAQEAPPSTPAQVTRVRPTPEMLGGKGGIDVLRTERAQKELKLSEEQQKKISELLERTRKELREYVVGLKELSAEERLKRMAEVEEKLQKDAPRRAAATRREIEAILRPEQLKRFRQLELQQDGPWILLRADVVEALQMTEAQCSQLEQIALDTQKGMRDAFRDSRQKELEGPQDRDSKIERAQSIGGTILQIRTQGLRLAGAVLTRTQKLKLVELMGGKRPVGELRIRSNRSEPPAAEKTPEATKTLEAGKAAETTGKSCEGSPQKPPKPVVEPK